MFLHTTICVLILLYMCPHTAIYVSSYYYICVLILLHLEPIYESGTQEQGALDAAHPYLKASYTSSLRPHTQVA